MAEDDYLVLLEKAKEELPETIEKHERFTVPEPDVFQEGKQTVIRNFGEIVDALRRDPDHLLHFLLRELGAPGSVEGRRAIIKAKISPSQIKDRINSYTETWVICSECGRPDTHINKDGRVLVLECEACGAHRPVHVTKTIRPQESDKLKAGDVLELDIEDVGRKGDGVARVGNIIIYIPGTVKGTRVKVKIEKADGKIAFGRPAMD
jgi:translation initiation factor 2 subunit 2